MTRHLTLPREANRWVGASPESEAKAGMMGQGGGLPASPNGRARKNGYAPVNQSAGITAPLIDLPQAPEAMPRDAASPAIQAFGNGAFKLGTSVRGRCPANRETAGRVSKLMRRGIGFVMVAAYLAACAPLSLQQWAPVSVPSGRAAFSAQGYTGMNETSREDALRYVNSFGSSMCKGRHSITRLDTQNNGNSFGKFLSWTAIVECDAQGREDAYPCSPDWKARKPERSERC